MNNAALAAQIRRDAERYGRENRTDDPEMRVVIARDVARLHAVAEAVERGDLKGAYKRWSRLDTIVREALSNKAWRALTGGNAAGHGEHDA